jgi:hypothetical protein
MGISASLLLIAVGAILRFGVKLGDRLAGAAVDWAIVGDVVMVIGAISLASSIALMASGTRRGLAWRDDHDSEASRRPYLP